MEIPQEEKLTTSCLSNIFKDTTATYKFYWFAGILDLVVLNGRRRIDAWEIVAQMVAKAWYPVCYFHLSLGKSDSLYRAILLLQKEKNISINISKNELSAWFYENRKDEFLYETFKILLQHVPYRLLSPWIKADNKELMIRSQSLENNCLYKIEEEEETMWIEMNPLWLDYLENNYTILKDFTYWNLVVFLQKRNPNVPNISAKVINEEEREPLYKQHHYWDFVISHGGSIRCIYTGKLIKEGEYDLDHFMPWSFVCHNLVWNLLPADSSINSSKSNKLPPLGKYLRHLAEMQQWAVNVALDGGFNGNVLDDYFSLGTTPQELADMSTENLYDCFERTYAPMSQIAQNMGFEMWK